MAVLVPRARCYYSNGYRYCDSAWNSWARWLFLGLIVGGFVLLFVCCSCVSSRRRRKAGQTPMYGTGWAAPQGHYAPPPQNNAGYYGPPQGGNPSQPAPPYSPPHQSGEAAGYYNQQPQGFQQQGYEMGNQPAYPNPSYARAGADNAYQPPPGPPPGKV